MFVERQFNLGWVLFCFSIWMFLFALFGSAVVLGVCCVVFEVEHVVQYGVVEWFAGRFDWLAWLNMVNFVGITLKSWSFKKCCPRSFAKDD